MKPEIDTRQRDHAAPFDTVPDGISIDALGHVFVGIRGLGIVYTLSPRELRQLADMLTEAAERAEANPAAAALAFSPVVGIA